MKFWQNGLTRYGSLSLKNKIFVSILGVVLVISVVSRWLGRF